MSTLRKLYVDSSRKTVVEVRDWAHYPVRIEVHGSSYNGYSHYFTMVMSLGEANDLHTKLDDALNKTGEYITYRTLCSMTKSEINDWFDENLMNQIKTIAREAKAREMA